MILRDLSLVLLALCAGPGFGAASEGGDLEPQEVIVEVAIGKLVQRTVMALESEGELLLPAREFFELVELRVHVDSLCRLSGVRYPEKIPLFVDPTALTAAAGDSTWEITRSQAIQRDGALYIATSVLAALLDVRLHLDWTELRITVLNPERLPVGRRIARIRARRDRGGDDDFIDESVQNVGLHRPGWDGAVLDWSLLYPGGGSPLDRTSYRAGLGMNVLGGSLELAYQDLGPSGDRALGSWLGVWPERAALRQLGLGDVAGTGPRPAAMRGAFLTNSPFVRPAFFDMDVLVGQLPPGWEVELYREGRLIDFADAGDDGRFRLQTPLAYGPNPLELRAYGPYGQMRLWEQAVRVQADRLPERTFEYGVTAGACRDRACDAVGNLDLHYGVSRALTLRVGAEGFTRDSLPDLFQPYASLIGNISSQWLVRGEALWKGFAGGDLVYEPSPDVRVGAGAAWFDSDVTAPLLTPRGRRSEYRAFGFWRPIPRLRTFFLETSALRVLNQTSSLTLARLGSSFQSGAVRWTAGVRNERSEAAGGASALTIVDVSSFVNLRSHRSALLDGLFLRAGAEASARGFERLEWLASRKMVGDTRFDVRLSWVRGVSDPFVAVGLTASLPAARSTSQLAHTPNDGVYASSFVEGSVIWNGPARRIDVAPGRSLGRGGLGGRVFLDANGNGRYDGNDEPLSAVRVQVGPHAVTTGEHGRFAVWDLLPFVEERVVLDSMSLPHPLWVPAFSLATVMVSPNGFRHLDVPVLPAAEVVGRVTFVTEAGARPLSGLRLELVNRETARRFQAITFYDGEFYVMGLPPGEYEVNIHEPHLRSLGALGTTPDFRFRVTLEQGTAVAPFLEIELTAEAR